MAELYTVASLVLGSLGFALLSLALYLSLAVVAAAAWLLRTDWALAMAALTAAIYSLWRWA
ncbi:MAG: hypothetical protein QNJ94_18695 [Alphaproteobacteria bacterium]|nr:hypothetical protein [Alphaproteobacteria bacterium]